MERTEETTPTPRPGDADPVDAPGADDKPSPLGAPDDDLKPVEDTTPDKDARGDAVGAVSASSADATTSSRPEAPTRPTEIRGTSAPTGGAGVTSDAAASSPTRVKPEPPAASVRTGSETPAPAYQPPVAPEATESTGSVTEERPELLLIGAFAAGLVLAIIIRRLGR